MSLWNANKPEDLWKFIRKTETCWPWTRCVGLNGYGQFSISNKRHYVHRVVFELANGPIPTGFYVLHTCDNKICCEPDHLFLGTHADNMADMVAKGRQASGDRNSSRMRPERLPRGEANGQSKLTANQVLKVRRLRIAGETHRAIGIRFGVSRQTIGDIFLLRTWKHVA